MKYYYPIILMNKRLSPVKISQEVEILRLKPKEREDYFGLKKIDFIFQIPPKFGHVAIDKFYPSNTKKGIIPYSSMYRGLGPFAGLDDIFASNYNVVIDCQGSNSADPIVEKVNLAFKLLQPTSTGAYIGFQKNVSGLSVYHDKPIGGPFGYLYLKKHDIHTLKKILSLITKHKDDPEFNLISKLYSRALSGTGIDLDIRFLTLITALECLYLPESDQELKLRLCLRVANLFGLLGNGKAQDIYKRVKKLYKIRNQIVHTGKSNKLNKRMFAELVLIIRFSLISYLNDRRLFNEKTLTDICLRPYVVSKA